jgi:hypothetical protein
MLPMIAGFGGIPMLVGFLVLRWGLRLVRANAPPSPDAEP